jgi:predicted TIM-barrel fold metal-dependent hydrolase
LANVPNTEIAYNFCKENKSFLFAANFSPDKLYMIEEYVNKGAKLIGEIKYDTSSDSEDMWMYCEVAQQCKVPILIHFENKRGINNLNNFEKTLKKFPNVNFIGHAVLWWAEIDGMTDKLMKEYKNLYADISANSGLRAMRKPSAEKFLENHQDNILFGSDCPPNHPYVNSPYCIANKCKQRLDQVCSFEVLEKIYYKNSQTLLKISL